MASEATLTWCQDLVADTCKRVGDLSALRSDPEQLHGRAADTARPVVDQVNPLVDQVRDRVRPVVDPVIDTREPSRR